MTAAIRIADTEGLEAVSMRRVAADCDTSPMSIYRHVRDKDDLIVQMMDAVLADAPPAADPGRGWRPRIEELAAGLWRSFRAHPWVAEALSLTRPQPIGGGLAYTDQVLQALQELTDDPAEAFTLHLVVITWVRGVAVSLEPERQAEAATGLTADQWVDRHEAELAAILDRERTPTFARVLSRLQHDGFDLDLDRLQQLGIGLLLDGLERRVHPPPAHRRPEPATSDAP